MLKLNEWMNEWMNYLFIGGIMKDREIKEQLSIRLPIGWVDKIYQIAEDERKSMNQVINELVEKAFKGA